VTPPEAEAEAPVPPAERERRRRLAWSTAIFAGATGISRVLGLVREIVAKNYFGVSGPVNAFTVAFQVPNLVRSLVADQALSAAFVPVFTDLLEKGDTKRAWRVASSLFWLLLLGLGGLTALLMVIAPLIIAPFGLPAGYEDLAVTLSRILFPIVTLLGVSGIVVGILNSYEHFTVPALTPVFWNLAIIAGLVFGVPHASSESAALEIYAVSILVGTIIQVALPFPWLSGRGGRLQMVIDWRDPAVARTFKLMLPVTLGLGLINVNLVIDSFFASRFIDPQLSPAAIDGAFRIYMLPQGVFSVAIATVLFPSLARFASRADFGGFRATVSTGLRQIAFLLFPASVACAVLADPIVRLLYQRGDFTADQTPVVAACVAAFAAGLSFNGTMLLLNRAFFSLQSNWVPTAVALGNLAVNAGLDALFYRFGTWGIPLSTTFVNIAGTAALLVLLKRRLGRIDFTATASAAGRILVASVVLGGVAYAVWRLLDEALGRSAAAQIASLGTAFLAGGGAYVAACRLLRVRELEAVRSLRRRRPAG
jgi:putative peptidoglycan lipid II flippase